MSSSPQQTRRTANPAIEAWRGFLTAHVMLVSRLEQELMEEVGLPLTWYEVLLILSEDPSARLRMHELAERRLLSRSAATRLIDRMEKAGLVERSPSDDDRRGTHVTLSPAGRDMFRLSAPIHRRGIEEHFAAHLDDAELAMMTAVTGRLTAALAAG